MSSNELTREDNYRQQAETLLRGLSKARELFSQHKPSIGYVGEEALRRVLKRLLPNDYDVCQGFVINKSLKSDETLSKQCDIIIYRKNKGAVEYSYGDIKIINANSVIAVIEVKSSIKEETFITTLKAFEKLRELGVSNLFVFIFNSISKKSLNKWFTRYRLPQSPVSEIITLDTDLYDWSDSYWVPKAILSLKSCKYFKLDHLQDDQNDWIGYVAYKIEDKMNKEVCCLQEFFASLMDLIDYDTFNIDINEYSIKDGFSLWQM